MGDFPEGIRWVYANYSASEISMAISSITYGAHRFFVSIYHVGIAHHTNFSLGFSLRTLKNVKRFRTHLF
jgi:hypothetical protein